MRVSKPPFLHTVRLPTPDSQLRIAIQLGFTEAADPVLRQVSFEYAELSAERRSQEASAPLNGAHKGVLSRGGQIAAVAAVRYSTRSTLRTDRSLVCDQSHVVRFVTQRQDYSLPKFDETLCSDERHGAARANGSKRRRE